MYKIELHLHTNIRSKCGTLSPEQEIEGYKAAGYSGIVVSDHYARVTARWLERDLTQPGDHLHDFLEGYRVMKELGEKAGIKVYRGAEMRFDGSDNDYLIYGYSDELMADPDSIFKMGPAAFYELAKADGALFIQAHPFRSKCCPLAPCFLDGYETVNRHDVHANYNEKAVAMAEKYGMLQTGGTDCHDPDDIGKGGIETDVLPADEKELTEILRSGNFKILGRNF